MNVAREIAEIRYALGDIVNELEQIASGLENEFQGVGSTYCAQSLRMYADRYRKVRSMLETVDTGKAGCGSGGGGGGSFGGGEGGGGIR